MNNIEVVKNKIKELDVNLTSEVLEKMKIFKISDFIGENGKQNLKKEVPTERGVYFILNLDNKELKFKEESDAKFAKGNEYKNLDKLYEEYNKGDKTIIYIGKADGKRGLNQRLKQYFRQYKSHSGGRLIWQIENNMNLGVTWIELDKIKGCKDAETYEKQLLDNYDKKYNLNYKNKKEKPIRPIANWRF